MLFQHIWHYYIEYYELLHILILCFLKSFFWLCQWPLTWLPTHSLVYTSKLTNWEKDSHTNTILFSVYVTHMHTRSTCPGGFYWVMQSSSPTDKYSSEWLAVTYWDFFSALNRQAQTSGSCLTVFVLLLFKDVVFLNLWISNVPGFQFCRVKLHW